MMQGAAAGAAAGAAKGVTQAGKPSRPGPQKAPSAFRSLAIAVAGAVITAAVMAAIMAPGGIGSVSPSSGTVGTSEPTLAQVVPAEIARAMATLDPETSQQAVADAKACKAPIAWVTLTKRPGSAGGWVRLRSGSYLSPVFHATEVPQRIAHPYPAPYQAGRGVLWVIGEGSGLTINLNPGWNIPSLNGAAPINVVWTPSNPC